jgi:lipoprotein-releasing system permease protein
VLGVTLGVAVLIIVISVMSGFDLQLREKILGFNPHLRIMPYGQAMTHYQEIMRRLAANPGVKSVAPFVLGKVLIKTQPDNGQPQVDAPWIRGIDPKLEPMMTSLASNIVEGTFDLNDRGVVVGTEFARNLGLNVGDRLLIYSPSELDRLQQNRGKEGESVELPDEYEVRGIYDVGYFDYNLAFIVASLADAQELYVLDDSVHGLFVMLKNPYEAATVQREFARGAGGGEERDVLPALFHHDCGGPVHPERADNVRGAEDTRDWDAQGAGCNGPAGGGPVFESKRICWSRGSGGRVWLGQTVAGLSQ